ncbi:neuromedin-U [Trichomycterus rosablanca]|uniref:neuromedin-U n=1 Tax=Trichomycterus rosablanca TaxID=2290929 RepID=UPI002F359455
MKQMRRGTCEGANVNTKINTTKTNTTPNTTNSAMRSFHNASLVLTILLVFSITSCTGVPMFLNPSTVEHDQLQNQIDNVCLSFRSEEQPLRMYDLLQDLCGVMLGVLQKTEDLSARETSKRFLFHYTKTNTGVPDGTSAVFHPLLQLIPQLHSRRRRRVHDNLQALRTIHSRGQFIYRPRNGRRSTEYV